MTKLRSGIYKNCLLCNQQYYIKPYLIPTSKYCSRRCTAKATTVKFKAFCQICNEEFEHISSRCNKAKYCSQKCYRQSLIGKGTITHICKHCNIEFKSYRRLGRKYCSKKCNGKANSSVWKPKFTTVRKQLLKLNKINKCERCEYNEYPKILGVHHKDRNRDNNNLTNLEILCPNCHSIEHMKHIVV